MTNIRRCACAGLAWTLLICSMKTAEAADAGLPPAQSGVMAQALKIAQTSDVAAACDFLEQQGTPHQVAANYSQIVRNLYFQKKDVPRMVLFARAGLRFCLHRARVLQSTDPKSARIFKGTAKTIAYNLAANTWPGWRDKGIKINPTDLAIGIDAAKTNLRLGRQLKRDDAVLGNAHWLVGAHELAAGSHAASRRSFTSAVERFRRAKKPAFVTMAQGYLALSDLAAKPNDTAAGERFDGAVAELNKLKSKDAGAFAAQLKSVRSLFVKPGRGSTEPGRD